MMNTNTSSAGSGSCREHSPAPRIAIISWREMAQENATGYQRRGCAVVPLVMTAASVRRSAVLPDYHAVADAMPGPQKRPTAANRTTKSFAYCVDTPSRRARYGLTGRRLASARSSRSPRIGSCPALLSAPCHWTGIGGVDVTVQIKHGGRSTEGPQGVF